MKNGKPIKEYNFLRLFCSTTIKGSYNIVIDRNDLQYGLYDFYDKEEYKLLFEDIVRSNKVDNKYVDLSGGFLTGFAYGLLSMVNAGGTSKYLINMSEEDSLKELDKYTEEEKLAASSLVREYYEMKEEKTNKPKALILKDKTE